MNNKIEFISWESLGERVSLLESDLILVVVDSKVWKIYRRELEKLSLLKKEFFIFKCLEGERTKNLKEYERALDFFLEKGIHRKAHLLTIGGGATSDFGGFVASSLLRGIHWSAIPTTLLAMVDASLGGKTGLNSKYGKNLIGAFHAPDHIWVDPSFLKSLDSRERLSGMGEIIKYAFLNKKIFEMVLSGEKLERVIGKCASFKEDIVANDFKEKGVRLSLNFGHTFGHALERIYDLSHGETIFWGMALIFKLYVEQENSFLKKLRKLEEALGADFGCPPWLGNSFPVKSVIDYVRKDKKKSSLDKVQLILVNGEGEFSIKEKEISEIARDLGKISDELKTFNP